MGFTLEQRKGYIYVVAEGTLMHSDYVTFIPETEKLLAEHPGVKVKALINMLNFDGWGEFQAGWDDFKYGMKHAKDFNQLALVTEKGWLETGVKAIAWMFPYEMKTFTNEAEAKAWLGVS